MRQRISFDEGWKFSLSDVEEARELVFDDSCWQQVTVPHDWAVGAGFEKHAASGGNGGFARGGTGWYRKAFQANEELLDREVFLTFDGIFMNSTVWINGELLGDHPYGYLGSTYCLTPYLKKGINLIAVRVDCREQPQSRWYTGCGIYRHVWLTACRKIFCALDGCAIVTEQKDDSQACVKVAVRLENRLEREEAIQAVLTIRDSSGNKAAEASETVCVPAAGTDCSFSVCLDHPLLWSPDDPSLYGMEIKLMRGEEVLDCHTERFGVRKAEFIPQKGFFLNGKSMKMKGVCLHHDCGVTGAAVYSSILKKRLSLLKEMGCNAIRTAHNPFSPEFYDLCDEMGFLVMDEFCDGWDAPKAAYDYGLFFSEWYERDVKSFVRRDRNHPCVVLWSIGNEVHQGTTEMAQKLLDLFHREDPTRLVTCGIQGTSEASDRIRALVDVAGYNDGGGACFIYARDHERRPEQLMIATEAPHTSQTRGFYRTQTWWRDKNQPRIEIPNLTEEEIFFDGHLLYSSSYDNSGVRVCARDSWNIQEETPYLCGEFRWSGIDYYGESLKWPARKSESGIIDSANFPKDHYYLYQSMWVDPRKKPMAHILPHWTHPQLSEGTVVPVWVYTNCEEAELFLNGESLGRKRRQGKREIAWDVPYHPGTLEAAAFLDGQEQCRAQMRTAGEPCRLVLTPDHVPEFDGTDTVQVDCTITDQENTMAPKADLAVAFSVSGDAQALGTENGDRLDLTPLTSLRRKAFGGLCALTLRPQKSGRSIRVLAAAILGTRVFEEKTQISIAVSECQVAGEASAQKPVEIYFTTDGTASEHRESCRYCGPFRIEETTRIRAEIDWDGEPALVLDQVFVKGTLPPVVDLAHGNKELNLSRPAGPFSEKMEGLWSDGSFDFLFCPGGELKRVLGGADDQHLGYWWYDFPVDAFEAQEYAGCGEIWFASGEKQKISMVTQQADRLVLENEQGGLGTAYGYQKQILLYKKEREQ